MQNHRQQEVILSNIAAGTATMADFDAIHELRYEMEEFRRGAEKALRWNTDKGAQG